MPPFNDVRVRRAISHAIDRQALIEAVWGRGAPTSAVARGLAEWTVPIDQLGAGAKYYEYDPQEARRLLAEAGYPKGFKTLLTVTSGLARDLVDDDAVGAAFPQRRRYRRRTEDPGVWRVCGHDGAGQVRGPDADSHSASPGNRTVGCIAPMRLTHPGTWATSMTHTLTAMLKEQRRTKRSGGAQEAHLRHSAVCRGATVLCISQFQYDHDLLAAVCEELCPEPQLRLRQSRRCPVAGSVIGGRRTAEHHGHQGVQDLRNGHPGRHWLALCQHSWHNMGLETAPAQA